MQREKDWVLVTWVIGQYLFDILLIVGTSYIVFWKNQSGWWFALAIILGASPSLYNVLEKRYQITDES